MFSPIIQISNSINRLKMKWLHNYSSIRVMLGFVWLSMVSCSSGKDIYKYSPQTSIVKTPMVNVTTSTSGSQAPSWIYAVSKDFVVGMGYGRDIMEAKSSALNDIKAFITKSLGETGSVFEVNFVQNSISGRNTSSSQDDYMMKYYFENEYQPVINISIDRFDDYYYEYSGDQARYYIKYDINDAELQQIKDEFRKSLQKEKDQGIRTKKSVDSLASFQGLVSIESLIERYNSITDFLFEYNLGKSDSLLLIRGLRNLKGFLDAVEIKVIKHNHGTNLQFGLYSGQTQVHTDYHPEINLAALDYEDMILQDGVWDLRYSITKGEENFYSIEIIFDLPYDRLTSNVQVNADVKRPDLKIVDQVLVSDVEVEKWTGNLKNLTVGFRIQSGSSESYNLSGMEMILRVDGTSDPIIIIDPVNQEIAPGLNRVIQTTECLLPSRFFLKEEISCDMRLYLDNTSSEETYELFDIPLSVNMY